MLQKLDQVTPENLTRLNREAIRDRLAIRRLFVRLAEEGTPLCAGINRRNEARQAIVRDVRATSVRIGIEGLEHHCVPQVYFTFQSEGDQYLFAAAPLPDSTCEEIHIALPEAVFRAERRDLYRHRFSGGCNGSNRVELLSPDGSVIEARIADRSTYGLGVDLPFFSPIEPEMRLLVRYANGSARPMVHTALVRHRRPSELGMGWTRVGLSLSHARRGPAIRVDHRARILERSASRRLGDRLSLLGSSVRVASRRVAENVGLGSSEASPVHIVDYANEQGQRLRAIVDVHGDPRGAPAIVIPPAWGRTKETLQPLAATLLETFKQAGQPVTIVRFDGTNRRGESHVDPECQDSGCEYLRFTFSQAIRDIEATIDFLDRSPVFRPSTTILVTFSLAAVEGRRAVANEKRGRIGGWVSVVGMVDLQSALRTISGGIDFGYGLQGGVRFGHHELVGVVADMDRTGLDALEHQLVFLEEARRDMAAIKVPVSWIHGRHDAWMDLERVRDALSCGDASQRKLIEVPTGHQLRTSTQALETFQLVAEEASEMALGRRLEGAIPDLEQVERRRRAERDRLPKRSVDLRSFWSDYLLGRDRRAGIELMTATAAYRNFMETQISALGLEEGTRVADLGSGTGDFALSLHGRVGGPGKLRVDQVDYVPDGLRRGEQRLVEHRNGVAVRSVVGDLDVARGRGLPLADSAYDAVIASLVISYLEEPEAFLAEVHRILRPGGKLVVSSLIRDADISKLFLDGMAELAPAPSGKDLGSGVAADFEELSRSFFNDASRILDFEAEGRFRFWDPRELSTLVADVGFVELRTDSSFGDPPQAVVLRATKR